MRVLGWLVVVLCVLLTACEEIEQAAEDEDTTSPTLPSSGGETGKVVDIIDGDTIDVRISGEVYRVRYIGVNTPERDDDCYAEATNANADLVEGQTVTLERDVSDTDQYGRLLRYVYVGDTFVNAALVADGYAEARRYAPDTAYFSYFQELEDEARAANIGCHPYGVFVYP